jgi:hypothetical protein
MDPSILTSWNIGHQLSSSTCIASQCNWKSRPLSSPHPNLSFLAHFSLENELSTEWATVIWRFITKGSDLHSLLKGSYLCLMCYAAHDLQPHHVLLLFHPVSFHLTIPILLIIIISFDDVRMMWNKKKEWRECIEGEIWIKTWECQCVPATRAIGVVGWKNLVCDVSWS